MKCETAITMINFNALVAPGRGYLGLIIFAGYVPLASQSPYPIVVDPYLVTFYFYELNHFFDRMKNTLLFICSTNILVRLTSDLLRDQII